MRISDWSSDVCSSDLLERNRAAIGQAMADRVFHDLAVLAAELHQLRHRRPSEAQLAPLARAEDRIVHMKLVSGEIFRPSIGIIVDDHGIGDGGGGIEMMTEDDVPKANPARPVAEDRKRGG